MARPDRLTPEKQNQIVDLVRSGVFIETACAAVGIGTTTYYRWIQKADDPNAPEKYREFRDAITRARATAEARNVAIVQRAANADWRASAWFLERSFPSRYGKREHIEHSGSNGGPITLSGLAQMMGVADEDDDLDDEEDGD
jgi:transposase